MTGLARSRRGALLVLGSGVAAAVIAGAALVAAYAPTEGGCEVETCSMMVVMKGGTDRAAAVVALHEYGAVSGLRVAAIRHGRVLVTGRGADGARPREAVRYSFVVSASSKDPADVAVGNPNIAVVIEPM